MAVYQAFAAEPRRLWLIEQSPTGPLCGVDRDGIAAANVVIYDRPLAELVAEALSLGGYAEPSTVDCERPDPAVSARTLRFASEGWSVARLLEPCPCPDQRAARLRNAANELLRSGVAGETGAIRIVAKRSGEATEECEARLDALPQIIGKLDGALLTVIFGSASASAAPGFSAFTANGLAG